MKTWKAGLDFGHAKSPGASDWVRSCGGTGPFSSRPCSAAPAKGPSPQRVDTGPARLSSAQAFCNKRPLGRHLGPPRGAAHPQEDGAREEAIWAGNSRPRCQSVVSKAGGGLSPWAPDSMPRGEGGVPELSKA